MAIGSSLNKLFNTAGTSKPQTGTGYTNLNKFLGANQGNQLGQKVAGNLQTQIGGVKSQLGEQKTAFETEAEKNKLNTEQNAQNRDQIIGRFSSASTEGGPLSEEDVSKVSQYRGGNYAGPTGLKDTSVLSQQAQDLAGQTSNLSPSGTQELLRRTVGGNKYTQGQQKLDSLLMDRSGLRQVGREAQSLGSDVNRANLAAQGQAQALAGQAKQFGQETTNKLQGALTGLDAEAVKQLQAAQGVESARQAQLEQLQRTLQGNQIVKLDPQGKPVVDENGNPVYETRLNNTTDPYARIDEVSKLLKDQGLVNQNQYEALFGKGSFSENKSIYDQEMAPLVPDEELLRIHGAGGEFYTDQKKAALEKFKTATGLAGRSTLDSRQDDFYKTLAASLGQNSQAAQGLTKEAVAGQPLRSNYTALAQLMGTTDVNPYTAEPTYQAGTLGLDAAQIKRALGY